MTNKEISRALKLTSALGELHDENPFKLKSLINAAFQVDRLDYQLEGKTTSEILEVPGIGKGTAQKITELLETHTTNELQEYFEKTPAGVVELLSIKGIGPKKVRQLWTVLEIESPGELLYACYENRLVHLKGFGTKTQESILQSIEYRMGNEGKLRFVDAEIISGELINRLQNLSADLKIQVTGELRRKMEVVSSLELLAVTTISDLREMLEKTGDAADLQTGLTSVTFKFNGNSRFSITCVDENDFEKQLLLLTGPPAHINELGKPEEAEISSEEKYYAAIGLPFILPELRDLPIAAAREIDAEKLVKTEDIKGTIHNHSTWSDGANTLKEMVEYCRDMGMEYFGICDHSKSAFYAKGLSFERVISQQLEIDALNKQMVPFRIFKGIESDILHDGSLDYPEEILKTFDFVVASVHSGLKMDDLKATRRIVKAIENPYTRILGHPSGRLLLARKPYLIDHKDVIDACAANGVVIELNAHPNRLDIDWRWIPYCLEKGVMISINADAHKQAELLNTKYGINVARKGGLTKKHLLNGLPLSGFEAWIENKR